MNNENYIKELNTIEQTAINNGYEGKLIEHIFQVKFKRKTIYQYIHKK